MDVPEVQREAFTALSNALKVLHQSLQNDAERLLEATLSLDSRTMWGLADISPATLCNIVKAIKDMEQEDIVIFLQFLNFNVQAPTVEHVVSTESERKADHAIMVGSVICRLPSNFDSRRNAKHEAFYDNRDLANTLRVAVLMRSNPTLLDSLKLFLTGRVQRLSDHEKNVLRGNYLYEASGCKIEQDDREWFGTHVEELVPVWSTLMKNGNFSRGYAEEIIAGTEENGTALMDGFL